MGLDTRQAMAVGTAGIYGNARGDGVGRSRFGTGSVGRCLVTGAAGGVGSVATAILANLGSRPSQAVTGRPETADYLTSLGCQHRSWPREDINETTKRPLGSVKPGRGCVDAVGGAMLARVLGQVKYGGSAAAVGSGRWRGACLRRSFRSCCAV